MHASLRTRFTDPQGWFCFLTRKICLRKRSFRGLLLRMEKNMNKLPSVPEKLIGALMSAKRVITVTHVKPDGDAYGSSLGLAGFLRAAGRDAVAVGSFPVPDIYEILDWRGLMIPASEYVPRDGDLIAVCDCGSPDRVLESMRGYAAELPSVCIDHHKTNDGFAGHEYIVPEASSASELVWEIARTAGWPLTRQTAEAIWIGIMTDTGRFAYDSTSPGTFLAASELLARGGVRTSLINECVYGHTTESRLRLQARAIESLKVSGDGRLAMISLSPADYAEFNTESVDSENFVDIPRSITGVEIAAFVYAAGEDSVKISLRTQPPHDAADFCKSLGGGGHARAAGATISGAVPEAAAVMWKSLLKLL